METPISYYALYHPTESLAWNVLSSDALTCRFNGDTPNTWAQACAVQYINVYHKFPMNMTWLSTIEVIPTFGQPSSESVKAVGHCRSPYSRKESWSPATLTNGAYYFKLLRCWSVEGYSNFHDFPCFFGSLQSIMPCSKEMSRPSACSLALAHQNPGNAPWDMTWFW